MTLGSAIKLVRTASGLKQQELAKRLEVSPNYISLIENGKREPSISFLNRLADTLGVPVGIFFLWQEMGKGRVAGERLAQMRELLSRLEAMYLLGRREEGRGKRKKNRQKAI